MDLHVPCGVNDTSVRSKAMAEGNRRRMKSALELLALVRDFRLISGIFATHCRSRKSNGKRGRWVGPGVRLRLYRLESAPNKVRVLSIDASARPTVDTVLATDELPGFESVSSMARRSNAIAAINGDYSRPSGRPVFTFARDGRLDQDATIVPETGLPLYGRNFSVDQSKSSVFLTHPQTRYWFWVPGPDGGASHRIDRMNDRSIQAHAASQIRAFTSVGGTEEKPPHRGCYVHLSARQKPQAANPTHAPRRGGGPNPTAGIERMYVVDKSVLSLPTSNAERGNHPLHAKARRPCRYLAIHVRGLEGRLRMVVGMAGCLRHRWGEPDSHRGWTSPEAEHQRKQFVRFGPSSADRRCLRFPHPPALLRNRGRQTARLQPRHDAGWADVLPAEATRSNRRPQPRRRRVDDHGRERQDQRAALGRIGASGELCHCRSPGRGPGRAARSQSAIRAVVRCCSSSRRFMRATLPMTR